MNKLLNKKFWSYAGRFSIIHVVTYSLIGLAFVIFQEALPVSDRVALDFFKPYSGPDLVVIFEQLIRGFILAFILYPFYKMILKSNRGWLIIFGALWGLALLGSVEPVPGSIEGFLYTKTTLAEHFIVLVAGSFQIFLFSRLFISWERWCYERESEINKGGINNE